MWYFFPKSKKAIGCSIWCQIAHAAGRRGGPYVPLSKTGQVAHPGGFRCASANPKLAVRRQLADVTQSAIRGHAAARASLHICQDTRRSGEAAPLWRRADAHTKSVLGHVAAPDIEGALLPQLDLRQRGASTPVDEASHVGDELRRRRRHIWSFGIVDRLVCELASSPSVIVGFPAVEIEGEHYWDGGLVSNTLLQWIAMTQRAAGLARLPG
jgi:hypothetical protein